MCRVISSSTTEEDRLTRLENLLTQVTCLNNVSLEGTLELKLLDISEKDVVELAGLLGLLGLLCLLFLDY